MYIRPEDRLLLECARTKLNESNQDKIRELASNGLDSDYLLQMRKTQGLTPLLYYAWYREESEELVKRFFTKFDPRLQTTELMKKSVSSCCFEL